MWAPEKNGGILYLALERGGGEDSSQAKGDLEVVYQRAGCMGRKRRRGCFLPRMPPIPDSFILIRSLQGAGHAGQLAGGSKEAASAVVHTHAWAPQTQAHPSFASYLLCGLRQTTSLSEPQFPHL